MKEILLAVILAIAMLVAYRRAARFGYENGFIDGYTSITEQIPLDQTTNSTNQSEEETISVDKTYL